MIHTVLYIGGHDYSKNILQGDQKTDDLTDVLDVVNLTLVGLTRSKEFEPSTRATYQKWYDIYDDNGEPTQILWKSWDLLVTEDVVEQPIISDENYFNHRITFNEASVVAQGRIVDNIATTYKLKDVSLDKNIIVDSTKKVVPIIENIDNSGKISKHSSAALWSSIEFYRNFKWEFPNWFDPQGPYANYNSSITDWENMNYFLGINTNPSNPSYHGQTSIEIPIPMLKVEKCSVNSPLFSHEGFCTIRVQIVRTNILTGKKEYLKKSGQDFVFDDELNITPSEYIIINPLDESVCDVEGEWNFETFPYNIQSPKGYICNYTTLNWISASVLNVADNAYFSSLVTAYDLTPNPARKITLSVNDNGQTLAANCKYEVNVSLWGKDADYTQPQYTNPENLIFNILVGGQREYYSGSSCEQKLFWSSNNNAKVTDANCRASFEFVTYDETNNKEIFTAEAPPQSAYELFVKAQLCSQNYEKVEGTPITDLSNLPFYLSAEDEALLKNTQVVENFYNQKNLWEIFIEIGKYIHAIPRIVFGEFERKRYLVTFDRLGKTEQFVDTAMPISIFNSKNIENYVSACSSYVSNMVQLGGVIDEWVAPKSSSEDYLVYNDVAEIIVSKPIIEIVDMKVKCIRNEGDRYGPNALNSEFSLVEGNGYVFEQNVYQLFSVDARTNPTLNKGLAIYYVLGSNKIQGLNYRLPSVNSGDQITDYAIKRILRDCLFNNPNDNTEIYINDFIFHIIYRTKDTVRVNQTRPDLRKYMLNSQIDQVPQHNQFNNQQDILVDSVKFGNNIYGKLIRTGNTEFTVTEWVQDLTQLKQIGQLYNLRGDIYYVAKVDNTYFVDHVNSIVTFSKDYNQLSEIIGIPSEPRFYEISEQNIINREFCINEYLLLGTNEPRNIVASIPEAADQFKTYFFKKDNNNLNGFNYIMKLLFATQTNYPKYAITTFKNDGDRTYGQVAGNENYFKEICSPISTYSVQNTLTMEWDMVDNFSAGDKVERIPVSAMPNGTIADNAYNALKPVRYPDVYGRVDLLDFMILDDLMDNNQSVIENDDVFVLPESPISSRAITDTISEFNQVDPTQQELDIIADGQQKENSVLYVIKWLEEPRTIGVNTFRNFNFLSYTYKDGEWVDEILLSNYTMENGEYYPVYKRVEPAGEQAYLLIANLNDYVKHPVKDYTDHILFSNETLDTMGDNQHGLALMKDNREAISINYNIQMLTDSDRFVLSSLLWQPDKQNVRFAWLRKEVNKLSNGVISVDDIIGEAPLSSSCNAYFDGYFDEIDVNIPQLITQNNIDLDEAKAFAIIFGDTQLVSQEVNFVLARNLDGLTNNQKRRNWFISGIYKQMFPTS